MRKKSLFVEECLTVTSKPQGADTILVTIGDAQTGEKWQLLWKFREGKMKRSKIAEASQRKDEEPDDKQAAGSVSDQVTDSEQEEGDE